MQSKAGDPLTFAIIDLVFADPRNSTYELQTRAAAVIRVDTGEPPGLLRLRFVCRSGHKKIRFARRASHRRPAKDVPRGAVAFCLPIRENFAEFVIPMTELGQKSHFFRGTLRNIRVDHHTGKAAKIRHVRTSAALRAPGPATNGDFVRPIGIGIV